MSRIKEYIVGGTPIFIWINSGVNMAPYINVLNGSEQVVSSATMSDSGNGHYYYWWETIPASHSTGYYVGKMTGTTGGKPFIKSEKIKLIGGGVD